MNKLILAIGLVAVFVSVTLASTSTVVPSATAIVASASAVNTTSATPTTAESSSQGLLHSLITMFSTFLVALVAQRLC